VQQANAAATDLAGAAHRDPPQNHRDVTQPRKSHHGYEAAGLCAANDGQNRTLYKPCARDRERSQRGLVSTTNLCAWCGARADSSVSRWSGWMPRSE
jgi:hypothetical protein